MRHPYSIGAFVLVAVLLGLAALLHLLVARRRTGTRLLWAAISLGVPVVGPLLYFSMGRAQGQFEDDEEEELEERVFVPDAYVAPAKAKLPPAHHATAAAPAPSTVAAPPARAPETATVAAPVRGARAIPPSDERLPPTILPDESLPLPRIAPIRVRAPLPPSTDAR